MDVVELEPESDTLRNRRKNARRSGSGGKETKVSTVASVNPEHVWKLFLRNLIGDEEEELPKLEQSKTHILKSIAAFNHNLTIDDAVADYVYLKYVKVTMQSASINNYKGAALFNVNKIKKLETDLAKLKTHLDVQALLYKTALANNLKNIKASQSKIAEKDAEISSLKNKLSEQTSSFEQRIKQQQDELDDEKGQKAKLALEQKQRRVGTVWRGLVGKARLKKQHNVEKATLEDEKTRLQHERSRISAEKRAAIEETERLRAEKDALQRQVQRDQQEKLKELRTVVEENKRRSDERRKDNERFKTKYLLMQRAVKDVESRQRKHEEKKKNRTILSKIKRVFTRKPVSKTPENFGKLEHRINEEVDKKKYNANLKEFNDIRKEHKAPKKKNNREVKTPQQPTLVRPQRRMSK